MFDVTVDDADLQEAIRRFSVFTQNATPTLVKISDFMEAITDERFDTQTDPDDIKWKPLSDRTVAARKLSGYPGSNPILYQTGTLKEGVQYRVDLASSSVVGTVEGDAAEYAPFLQEGAGKMPSRRFLGLDDEDADALENVILRSLARELLE